MTNGNGNSNLKWKRQPAAVVHFLAENISYSFRIYGQRGRNGSF